MKKMNLVLVFALAVVLVPFTVAQDTNSQNSSTAATTQNANSSTAVSSESGAQDANLTQQLQSKFSQDPAFVNVQASVTNGTALITGTVASKADEKRAKDLAKSISGVKKITSNSVQDFSSVIVEFDTDVDVDLISYCLSLLHLDRDSPI